MVQMVQGRHMPRNGISWDAMMSWCHGRMNSGSMIPSWTFSCVLVWFGAGFLLGEWGAGVSQEAEKRGRDQVSDFLCAVFQQIYLVNVGYFGFWDLDGFRAPIHHRSIVFHFRPAKGQREGEHRKPRRLAIEVAAPAKLQEEVYVTWCCRPSSFCAEKWKVMGRWWDFYVFLWDPEPLEHGFRLNIWDIPLAWFS